MPKNNQKPSSSFLAANPLARSYALIIGLTVAYFVTGRLGTFLAIPPGYATAIWPPSGIALASILIYGYRVWPGILLGSFLVNISTALVTGSILENLSSIIITLAIGGGASLQAVVGAYLVRRFAGFPNSLCSEKDIFLFFFWGGILSALVNSTIAVSVLFVAGQFPASNLLANWGTWWMGDALGILIFAPVILVWWLHSSEPWHNRRMQITLPVITIFILTTLAVFYQSKNENERLKLEFDQAAVTLKMALEKSILTHLNVLHSIGSFYAGSTSVDRAEFRRFITHSLNNFHGIKALEWAPSIRSSERNSFEASLQSEGYQNFHITERDANNQLLVAGNRTEYVPVSFIEPYQGNENALGYDVYSNELRREAIDRARDTGQIAVTARIRLVQEKGNQYGILAFLPIYRNGLPRQTLEQRRSNISGYVVAVFQGNDIVTAAFKELNRKGLSYRLIDQSAPAAEQLIFASDRNEFKPLALQEKGLFGRRFSLKSSLAIPVGGRSWQFEVVPTLDYLADHRSNNVWLTLLTGLILTSFGSLFFMTLSGRGTILRKLIDERTAALTQSEQRFRATFEGAPVGVVTVLPSGRFLSANQGFCEFVGYSRDELLSMTFRQVTHRYDAEVIKRVLAGDISEFNREEQYLHKDGSLVWSNLSVRLIRQEDGSPDYFVAVVENINSRKQAEDALKNSEAKFRTLYNSSSDAVMLLDANGFFDCNQSALKLFGCSTVETFCTKHPVDMSPPEQPCGTRSEVLANQNIAAAKIKGDHRFEWMHKRIDTGEIFSAEVLLNTMELDGRPVLQATVRDISERKKSEILLLKLSLAVEQSPNAIVITDVDVNIEYVNQAFVTITGYSRDEIIGKNPRLLRSGKTPKTSYDDMWAALTSGKAWKGEFTNKKKNGAEYIESAWISPVHQIDGKISHYLGIKEDITARKRAETLLLESEQRFRAVADAAPVLIWLAGVDKFCFWFNQVWMDFTGRTLEQELGNGWAEGVHPDDLGRCLDCYVSHFNCHEPFRIEYRLKHRDGEYRWLDDHGVPRFDTDGEFIGYIGSCSDITEIRQIQNQLQASHNQFTELSLQVPGMVYQLRLAPDGRYSFPYTSIGIQDIYEVTPEQVSEDAALVFAVLHPDDYDMIVASIELSAHTLEPWHLEYRVNLPKKGMRWLSGLSKPKKLNDGGILWHGFITDITDQVNARDEANKTKIMLENVLFSATGISIIATDPEGLIKVFNRGAELMLGYSANEIIDRQTPAIIHLQEEVEQRGKELEQELGRTVSGFNVFIEKTAYVEQDTHEWTYIRKDRSTLTVSLVVTAMRNRQGEITGYLGIADDITERKQAESERDLLLKIIEDAPDFISTADMQSHLKYINTAGAMMVGLSEDADVSALSIKDMHPEWAAQLILTEGIPVVLRQGFWQGETALLHRDGHEIPVAQLLLLHRDDSGKPLLLSTIMRDISVNQQAKQAMLLAKQTAEELAQSKSDFLANMSHEIRTPMNAIIGLSHLALSKELSFEIRDYLEKINSASNSLLGILNDILDFSKLDAGRLSIDHAPFNLEAILDVIRNLFAILVDKRHLTFNIEAAPDVPRNLIGDSLRLQQILINLVGNALKFTEQGSVTLKITARRIAQSEALLLFCVTDTGIGMSADDREKLFHPFSQADGSITRRFGGTGLGLAISHNLLALMGGKFSVESTPGKGSCFSFELVLGISSLSCLPPLDAVQVDLSQLLVGVRVLVAEDNLINQQVVLELLKLSGIIVEIANNGDEAIKLLENGVFDAVLMDIHMPVLDGFEATKLIRSQVRFARLPVIALTAGVTKEEREKCIALGMNGFIAKPINPKKLLATLVHWIKPIAAVAMDSAIVDPMLENLSGTDGCPVIDLNKLLAMLDNNHQLATQLLFNFMESTKDLLSEIENTVASGNFVLARELIHQIKGASGNVGAMQLYVASEALEVELSSAAVFNIFRVAFKQTMSVIAELSQPEEMSLATSGNSKALERSVAELDFLLKENDFISEALLNTLKPHLALDQLDLFTQLRKLINGLQYDEARKVLWQIAKHDTQAS